MARPKRKQIEFTEESVKSLLQEAYNETSELRAVAIALFNKWKNIAPDKTDVAMMGKDINQLIKAQEGCIDKKIIITKIVKEIVYKDEKSGDKAGGFKISEEARKELNKIKDNYKKENNTNN